MAQHKGKLKSVAVSGQKVEAAFHAVSADIILRDRNGRQMPVSGDLVEVEVRYAPQGRILRVGVQERKAETQADLAAPGCPA